MSGYKNLIWLRDNEGKEYVCNIAGLRRKFKDGGELSSEERCCCRNINEIVGTERW